MIKAKKQEKDTEIICFAAQNKWVCAPADQQELANTKAQKLLSKSGTEAEVTDVVIRPINIPKFNSSDDVFFNPVKVDKQPLTKEISTKKEPTHKNTALQPIKSNDNPYAKLWSHQLIGLSTPNRAIKFVNQKNLNKEEVLIIQSTRDNMDWWIVLYGLYNNKQTGLDNEINLPKNLNNAWLRPLKGLKVNGFIDKF